MPACALVEAASNPTPDRPPALWGEPPAANAASRLTHGVAPDGSSGLELKNTKSVHSLCKAWCEVATDLHTAKYRVHPIMMVGAAASAGELPQVGCCRGCAYQRSVIYRALKVLEVCRRGQANHTPIDSPTLF